MFWFSDGCSSEQLCHFIISAYRFFVIKIMSHSVKILILPNEIEARLLDEILIERDIPHMIRSFHDSAYDGLWQTESAWGRLDAPEEFKDEILGIYNEMTRPENQIEPA